MPHSAEYIKNTGTGKLAAWLRSFSRAGKAFERPGQLMERGSVIQILVGLGAGVCRRRLDRFNSTSL